VSTHNKHKLQATSCSKLADIGLAWREYDVVGIDEGQFFPDLLSFCETVANAGKVVVVAALDGTFQRKVCLRTQVYPRTGHVVATLTAFSGITPGWRAPPMNTSFKNNSRT
jgi:hypothetical protein